MRHLPKTKTQKQKIIIQACLDYYGSGASIEDKKSTTKIALWIMNRKKGVNLSEQEMSDVWAVKANLNDPIYAKSLSE